MKVPMLDLKAQFITIEKELRQAIDGVLDTQRFIMGGEVIGLEEQIAEYSQTQFGIGCASGSDALLLALMAINIQPGDAVITTPYTFFATGGAVSRLNAIPIFVDIDPETYNIDPQKIEEVFSGHHPLKDKLPPKEKIKAVIPVHLYGQITHMDEIMEVSKKHNLIVIEDAAQAIGSEYKGKRAGTIGHFGCFSFFPSKNLGCMGDGGMVVTNDSDYAEKLRVLRLHGSKPKYYHKIVGLNSRLDSIQAAILRVKLKYLDSWTEARQVNANWYTNEIKKLDLGDKLKTPYVFNEGRHIYNQYTLRCERRDELKQYLIDNGVGCEIYYPVPLHIQECFSDLGYKNGDLPISEKAANEALSIPIYPELTNEQKQHVVDTINKFYS